MKQAQSAEYTKGKKENEIRREGKGLEKEKCDGCGAWSWWWSMVQVVRLIIAVAGAAQVC